MLTQFLFYFLKNEDTLQTSSLVGQYNYDHFRKFKEVNTRQSLCKVNQITPIKFHNKQMYWDINSDLHPYQDSCQMKEKC